MDYCGLSPWAFKQQVSYQAPLEGRRYHITKEQLEFLIDCHITIRQMADVLNVSHSVVKRCMSHFQLFRSYSLLSDAQLDERIKELISIKTEWRHYKRKKKASDTNRSATVMESFEAAITSYGVPSRVRCDRVVKTTVSVPHGAVQGWSEGSALRGRSTHNQRIERLWGDVWHGVSKVYHDLFTFLETEQIIDINNEVHLWALHFVFLPRVNRDLAVFASQWNHHRLRTKQRQSPLQLFVSGSLAMQRANLTSAPPTTGATALYWSEWVIVPQIQFTISNTQTELLRTLIPLEGPRGSLGVDNLQRVMAVISSVPLVRTPT
eukprot:XP_014021375.1 PREDICTED: uncharacterized protein LOC106582648 [Salmo salar]